MTSWGALYAAEPIELDADWLEARAGDASVEGGDGSTLVLRWGEEELRVHAEEPARRESLVHSMQLECDAGEGEVALARERLGVTKGILFVRADRSFDEASRALAWIRAVQKETRALLVRGDRVEDEEGKLLVTLPPEDDGEVPPPDARRVVRRAQVMAAVIARAFLEHVPKEQGNLSSLWEWLDRHELWEEAEPGERDLIRTDRAMIPPQAAIDGTWRAEGLAVLAWALGAYDLPAHDVQADPQHVTDAVGLFADPLPAAMTSPALRAEGELQWQGDRLLGVHWRLRDFSLRPVAMDFTAFAASCWFGSFDLTGIATLEQDLAIEGRPISKADPDAVRRATSIALERHQAINWLRGYGRVYSQVDTST